MQTAALPALGFNAPATVIGWDGDGGAKVELLAHAPGLPLGAQAMVRMRPDGKGRRSPDFQSLYKKGLRVGGIVLLRRLLPEDDGSWSVRYVEPLVIREAHGISFVIRGAGACILPPPPGTARVDHCLVAAFRDSFPARSLSEAMSKVASALDRPCLMGEPGLIFTGRTRGGEAVEVKVGGDGAATPQDLLSELISTTPKDVIKESRTSGTKREPWRIVPFFKAPIPFERRSRMSALSTNHPYGTLDEPLWTVGNVVMHIQEGAWHAADATPSEDAADPAPALNHMG